MMGGTKQKGRETPEVRAGFVVFYNPYEAGAASAGTVLEESLAFLKTAQFTTIPAPVMVHDIATARQAGQYFKNEGVQIIIVHLATWSDDDLLVEMIARTTEFPAIINWALRDMNTGSLCGCQQFNMVLKELLYHTMFVLGRDAAVLESMADFVAKYQHLFYTGLPSKDESVNATIDALGHLRVGIFGARTQGMMEVAFDEFGIKFRLGPSVCSIPVAELENRAMKVPCAAVDVALESFKEKFRGIDVTASTTAVEMSIRNYLALKELVKEHYLDVVTIDCYPGYMGRACIAFSMLADEGIACACEADVHAAILAWLVQRLSGHPVNHIDLLDVDQKNNTITGGHCGACSLHLARPGSAVVAPVRLANEGACVMFPAKEGPVTLVNLVGQTETYRICIITGTAIETGLVFPGNPTTIKLNVPVDKFFKTVGEYGLGHHWIVGQGTHYASTLVKLFQTQGIKVCSVL